MKCLGCKHYWQRMSSALRGQQHPRHGLDDAHGGEHRPQADLGTGRGLLEASRRDDSWRPLKASSSRRRLDAALNSTNGRRRDPRGAQSTWWGQCAAPPRGRSPSLVQHAHVAAPHSTHARLGARGRESTGVDVARLERNSAQLRVPTRTVARGRPARSAASGAPADASVGGRPRLDCLRTDSVTWTTDGITVRHAAA